MALDAGTESVLDTVEKRVTQRASQIDVSSLQYIFQCTEYVHVYIHSVLLMTSTYISKPVMIEYKKDLFFRSRRQWYNIAVLILLYMYMYSLA